MEAKLNQNIQKMMTHVGASGVSVADKNGLALISKGNLDSKFAATSTLMMADAKNFSASAKYENPIITLHSTNGSKLTIVNRHGETVTLLSK